MTMLTVDVAERLEIAEIAREDAKNMVVKAYVTVAKGEQYDTQNAYTSEIDQAFRWFSRELVALASAQVAPGRSDGPEKDLVLDAVRHVAFAKTQENAVLDELKRDPVFKDLADAMSYDDARVLIKNLMTNVSSSLTRLCDNIGYNHPYYTPEV